MCSGLVEQSVRQSSKFVNQPRRSDSGSSKRLETLLAGTSRPDPLILYENIENLPASIRPKYRAYAPATAAIPRNFGGASQKNIAFPIQCHLKHYRLKCRFQLTVRPMDETVTSKPSSKS